MISLAPIKYNKARSDGIIREIQVNDDLVLDGKRMWTCHCLLREGLIPDKFKRFELYGNWDGTGTHPHRSVSIHKAISESLERWAYSTMVTQHPISLGLHLDSSTAGFAAFPSLCKSAAREHALMEATERWSLKLWWEGRLANSAPVISDETQWITLETPWRKLCTVVGSQQRSGHIAYGFATARSEKIARTKARIELERNHRVLEKPRSGSRPLLLQERRLLYFSTPEGHKIFQQRIVEGKCSFNRHIEPQLVVDSHVPGPWARYTQVWRCLFDSTAPDPGDLEYFMF